MNRGDLAIAIVIVVLNALRLVLVVARAVDDATRPRLR
jgi:hypothetical protein